MLLAWLYLFSEEKRRCTNNLTPISVTQESFCANVNRHSSYISSSPYKLLCSTFIHNTISHSPSNRNFNCHKQRKPQSCRRNVMFNLVTRSPNFQLAVCLNRWEIREIHVLQHKVLDKNHVELLHQEYRLISGPFSLTQLYTPRILGPRHGLLDITSTHSQ